MEDTSKVDDLPVSRLFDGLTEKELLIIRLMCFENKTARDIKEEYGISLYSIYSTLRRAREKIKKNI
jgi:RNA polymerase sigma factor (sigma-70 family)